LGLASWQSRLSPEIASIAMIRSLASSLVVLSLLALSPACDSGPSPEELKAQEEAAAKKAAEEKALADGIAKRKADREAKEKAKEDAEKARLAEIDALCVLPEKMPKNLDKACAEVAAANDRFMLRLYEGEAVTKWNAAKGTQLQMQKATCMKTGSIEAAACQINAMDNTPPEHKKALPDILRACIEKFRKVEEAG
jgi:hypothetical protein